MFKTNNPNTWCAGCPDFMIKAALERAMTALIKEEGWKKEELVFESFLTLLHNGNLGKGFWEKGPRALSSGTNILHQLKTFFLLIRIQVRN